MISLYCTADSIGSTTGGGVVTRNELKALDEISDTVHVISRSELSPGRFGLPQDPFMEDYIACEMVENLLKTTSFDIAHFYAGCFSHTVRRLKMAGTKVTYTAAAHDKAESEAEHLKLGLGYNYPHMKDPLWKTYLSGYASANTVICPSSMSARLMSGWGCPSVAVVPHGVDIVEKPSPLPANFAVGYLGQPGVDKGLLYLFRAWKMCGFTDATLHVAGRDTDQLIGLVRGEGAGNVNLMGWVDSVDQLYDATSVYIQPSVSEGFGIEILEAMARGRPVIASSGAGGADVVVDGLTGFVVPPRDVEAISRRLKELKDDPAKLAKMGAAAKHASGAYTWEMMRNLYKGVWAR